MKPQNLVISGITIKQDSNLRYRLNDLHKVSGLPKSKAPSEWLRYDKAKEYVEFLRTGNTVVEQNQQLIEPLSVVNGGNKQGVYATKKLVYSYAMWLSVEFHDHVIDAYDELVSKERAALEWQVIRGDSKKNYKDMTLALKNYYLDKGEVAPFYAYSSDADMLNLIVIGMKSKQYKQILQLDDKANIREFMTTLQLEAYDYLEVRNVGYLDDGLDFTERTVKLKGLFDKRFRQRLIDANDDVISIAHSE